MLYDKSLTATVYICYDNQILLHQHKKYKTWFPVGGHVESNEFPHEAAIREAKEEAGIEISLVETEVAPLYNIGRVERLPSPFCIYAEHDDEDFFDFIYIAIASTNAIKPGENESSVFRWFNKDELCNEAIKPHVKNTALAVLEFLNKCN